MMSNVPLKFPEKASIKRLHHVLLYYPAGRSVLRPFWKGTSFSKYCVNQKLIHTTQVRNRRNWYLAEERYTPDCRLAWSGRELQRYLIWHNESPKFTDHFLADHNLLFIPYYADEASDTLDGIFEGDPATVSCTYSPYSRLALLTKFELLKSTPSNGARMGRDYSQPSWGLSSPVMNTSHIWSHSGIDAGIKHRPNEKDLKIIGPTFTERWNSFFSDAPDKPVMWIGPIAGYNIYTITEPWNWCYSCKLRGSWSSTTTWAQVFLFAILHGRPSIAISICDQMMWTYWKEYPASLGRVHIQGGLNPYAPLDLETGFLDEYVLSVVETLAISNRVLA